MAIRLVRASSGVSLPEPRCGVLGSFDALHLGHRALIAKAVQDGLPTVVVSFYRRPASILSPSAGGDITSLRQKLSILESWGVEAFYLLRFSPRLQQMPGPEFIREVLWKRLNVQKLFIGPDAGIGKNRETSAARIREIFEAEGREVEVVPFIRVGDSRASSSRVRECIRGADFKAAEALLGRPYAAEGRVVPGAHVGTRLGFPTANLHLPSEILVPDGVYASDAVLKGRVYRSLTNIGTRPTFSGRRVSFETHLLDFPYSELYGQRLEVRFLMRLRDEIKFKLPEALAKQIREDIELVRTLKF